MGISKLEHLPISERYGEVFFGDLFELEVLAIPRVDYYLVIDF
jgi:hypothetical protein